VRRATGVVARDLGSKNGVVVAGARIDGERALVDGDVLQIGPVTLRLDDPVGRYLRELEAAPPPEPVPAPAQAPAAPLEGSPRAPAPSTRLSRVVVVVAVSALLLTVVAAVAIFL
jgi:hypothetical protein